MPIDNDIGLSIKTDSPNIPYKGVWGMSISLCMIAKDEEENIGRALESIKDVVDEMIVVDTGSTDSTVKIAESYGAKVYYFEWNNNFSDARNFSLEKASGDWILIMDADDEFVREDAQKLIDLTKKDGVDAYFMETLSFVGDRPGYDIVMNLNVRLIKNKKEYRFLGTVHEQIACNIMAVNKDARIETARIKFYHYGYLNKTVSEKNKRRRNIELLEKSLELEKDNKFLFFCMGNEYLALKDFSKALEYYMKTYENFNPDTGYSPHLLARMAICFDELEMYDKEMEIINLGLGIYENFTDLEFLKACLYHRQNKFTLAIKSFKRCIEMGEPPSNLALMAGVGSFKACCALSEIYLDMKDYDEAYKCCIEALKLNPGYTPCLYIIAEALFKKYERNMDIDYIKSALEDLFGGRLDGRACMALSNVFYKQRKYDIAYEYITKAEKLMGQSPEILYYKGTCLFYLKNFNKAIECYKKIKSGEFYQRAINKLFLSHILTNNTRRAARLLSKDKEIIGNKTVLVYKTFKEIMEGKNCKPVSADKDESREYLSIILDLLNILLKISEFDIFEKALQFLNLIESDEVLLGLAKLYYVNGFYQMAYNELIRSIKIFDRIDAEGIEMMRNILAGTV